MTRGSASNDAESSRSFLWPGTISSQVNSHHPDNPTPSNHQDSLFHPLSVTFTRARRRPSHATSVHDGQPVHRRRASRCHRPESHTSIQRNRRRIPSKSTRWSQASLTATCRKVLGPLCRWRVSRQLLPTLQTSC
jgi:hypothetical protein